jgi:Holliday junction DNA helicase RuvA
VIASLEGIVARTQLGVVVLSVNGVGYSVNVSAALSAKVSAGEKLHLQTSFIVREDAHTLFGFAEVEELEMFDLLRSVTGVGPKSALGIVSAVGVEEIRNAVASERDSVFKAVSGIGPKTAKLITVTLAGKLTSTTGSADSELISALVGLGYKEAAAAAALKEAQGTDQQTKLRSALSILSGSNK